MAASASPQETSGFASAKLARSRAGKTRGSRPCVDQPSPKQVEIKEGTLGAATARSLRRLRRLSAFLRRSNRQGLFWCLNIKHRRLSAFLRRSNRQGSFWCLNI
ncbi:hypothetical protein DIPPA_51858 [Diplonema papillatum]|nr:hypothetical protein DIPPA_51858 [Diplonema papillatum]